MKFSKLLEELHSLNLPSGHFAVTSSGVMAVRGLREANDLDLIVTKNLWNNLVKKYKVEVGKYKTKIQVSKNIEVMGFEGNENEVEEEIKEADVIGGIRFVKLEKVIKLKQKMGREKDLADIKLIKEFLYDMEVVIRRSKSGEADMLIDIYKGEGVDVKKDDLTKNVKRDFTKIGKDREIWFAEIDGKTVGSIQLIFKSKAKDKANRKDVAMVHHMRVAKEFEAKGIGSSLHKVVEATAKKKGLRRLILEVEKDNLRAIEIYRHWGYKYLREGENKKEIVMNKNIL